MAVVQPVTMPNGDIQDLPNTPPRHDAYDIANLLDQVEITNKPIVRTHIEIYMT